MMGLEYIHHEFAPNNLIPARLWDRFLGYSQYFEDYASMCVDRKLKTMGAYNFLSDGCVEYLPCLTIVQIPKMNGKDHDLIYSTIQQLMFEYPQCNTVFQLATDQTFYLQSPEMEDFLLKSHSEARKKYPINCYFKPSVLNIAIHIRRGDVSSTKNTYRRYIPNEEYLSIVSKLINLLEDRDYKSVLERENFEIHIYSEGKPEDFGEIQNLTNVQFHLNDDLFETLHHMSKADILVGSFSGFSTFANIFVKGISIFPFITFQVGVPFENGDFNEEQFDYWWNELKDAIKNNSCEN